MIAGDKNDFIFPFCKFGELRGADGMFQGILDEFLRGFLRNVVLCLCRDDCFQIFFFHVQIHGRGVVRDGDGSYHAVPPFYD